MLKNLRQVINYFVKNFEIIFILLLIVINAVFILSPVAQDKHWVYNLEPYPDGLLYTLSGRNLISRNYLGLVYEENKLSIWVSPIYSIFLSVFYTINDSPLTYLVGNFVLAVTNILLLHKLFYELKIKPLLRMLLLLLYVTQVPILWLSMLPMSENISLTFFIACGYLIFSRKVESNKKLMYLGILVSILLALSRLSLVPLGFITAVILFINYNDIRVITRKRIIVLSSFAILSALLFSKQIIFFISDLLSDSGFFSIKNVIDNTIFYFKALTGFKSKLLWLDEVLINPLITLSVGGYCVFELYKKRWKILIPIFLFVSQFSLIIFLNVYDARYIVYAVPLGIIILSLLMKSIQAQSKFVFGIVLTILVTQIIFIHPLLRPMVSANFLGSSAGWQYEAVLHFNEFFSDKAGANQAQIITALPPFLVDVYQQANYSVLPLSEHQEFIAKDQRVWGENVPYKSLLEGYESWLKEGKDLYISNAYITHQQSVISDFEMYKQKFDLVPVSSGCLEACNIYKLVVRQ